MEEWFSCGVVEKKSEKKSENKHDCPEKYPKGTIYSGNEKELMKI